MLADLEGAGLGSWWSARMTIIFSVCGLYCLVVFFSVYSIKKADEKPDLGCLYPQREGVAISLRGSCPIAL